MTVSPQPQRGFSLIEMALVTGMLALFMLVGIETQGHHRGDVGTSMAQFRALVESAQVLASSTEGDINAVDGSNATYNSGATIIVTPTGSGSIAALYRYRPTSIQRLIIRDSKTSPLILSASLSASNAGETSTSFAMYFASSGYTALSANGLAAVVYSRIQAEPACVAPQISFTVGGETRAFTLNCEDGSLASVP